jgi:hypothetical protein
MHFGLFYVLLWVYTSIFNIPRTITYYISPAFSIYTVWCNGLAAPLTGVLIYSCYFVGMASSYCASYYSLHSIFFLHDCTLNLNKP